MPARALHSILQGPARLQRDRLVRAVHILEARARAEALVDVQELVAGFDVLGGGDHERIVLVVALHVRVAVLDARRRRVVEGARAAADGPRCVRHVV